jgi:hypothetical protein
LTGVSVVTVPPVILKVALFVPAGTVTVRGTVAAELLDFSKTTAPPAGAKPFRCTVQVMEEPLATALEVTVIETSGEGRIWKLAVVAIPFRTAVITTVWAVETLFGVTLNLTELDPAGIVTVLGTVA